jgi:hypothetical protein
MMKKAIPVIAVVLMFAAAAGPLAGQWVKSFHFNVRDSANSIAQAGDGGYIVAGTSWGGTAAAQEQQAILIKLSPNGDSEWQRSFGGSKLTEAKAVQRTYEGGYIVAGTYGTEQIVSHDIWVAKLSSSGAIEWQRVFGGSDDDEVNSIEQTLDGGYILCGTTASFGAGKTDFWLVKLLPSGAIEWQKTYGGADYELADSVQPTADGGYILAGTSSSLSPAGIWAAKIQANGLIEWQKSFQPAASSYIAIQPSSEGGYALTGSCNDGVFILKLSALGAIEWQKGFKAPYRNTALVSNAVVNKVAGLCQTSDNGYVVASHNTYSSSWDQGNHWVVKVNGQGALAWERAFEGSSDDQAACLRRTSDDCLLLAASTEAFNSKGRMTTLYSDMMVMKLSSQGDLNANCGLASMVGNETLEPNIQPSDVDFQTQNSSAGSIAVDIAIGNPNAEVHDFCAGKFLLSIKTDDLQYGTTDPAPGLHAYDPGSQVSIQAVPSAPAYKFSGWWIGGALNASNPLVVTMNSHQTVDTFFATTKWDVGSSAGSGSGSHCFIATAAYNTPLHPAVRLLRSFRDKRLLTNGPGRAFVSSYYKWSPAVAQIISRSAPLRFIVRILLLPVIGAAALILVLGWPAGLAVGGGSTMTIMNFRRSRKRRKGKI